MEKEIERLFLVIAEGAQEITEENYQEFDLQTIDAAMTALESQSNLSPEEKTDIAERLYVIAKGGKSVYYEIYVLSFLALFCNSAKYYEAIQLLLLENCDISKEEKFFLYYQMISKQFTNGSLQDEATQLNQNKLYKSIVDAFREEMDAVCWIPVEKRNRQLIVIMTSQLLAIEHGPTKTALDRASIIRHTMGKEVLIINTAEFLPARGYVPFYKAARGSYNRSLTECEMVEYMGEQYPYVQCEQNMPNAVDINSICAIITQLKPYCIVGIGGSSVATDLCSGIVPTIMVTTVPSGLAVTEGQFQVIGRKKSAEDERLLSLMGKSPTHTIEGRFTSSLLPQKEYLTRAMLGLPEDAFVCYVVGGRLDEEIQEEFASILNRLMQNKICVAFAGKFEKYPQWCETYPAFAECGYNLGFQTDMLAAFECCNLYINPKRVGGGTSVIEAMSKGLPAVTMNYGDVGLGAGENFWTKDYETMYDIIIKYASDAEFYHKMSELAKARAAYMLDGAAAFVEIIAEAEKRSEFR